MSHASHLRTSPTRADVRRELLRRGWHELPSGALSDAGVIFRSLGRRRESVLKLFEGHPHFEVHFPAEIPCSVIVAACLSAAEYYGKRERLVA